MNLNPDRLYQLPDEEAFRYYQALWYAGLADASIHLRGAYVARRLERRYSAHSAILQAKACQPEGELKGKVDFYFAESLRLMGNQDDAIEHFSTWLTNVDQAFPSLRDSLLGAAYYNLGLSYRQVGRFAESLESYWQACSEFRRLDQPEKLRMALQNLAWVACLAGQDRAAGEALTEAEPLCTSVEAAWQQKIGHAFYLAITPGGGFQKAMGICQEIVDCTEPDIPAAVRAQAYWIAGRAALALNQIADAERMAERALLWGATAGPSARCLLDASALWQEVRKKKENSVK